MKLLQSLRFSVVLTLSFVPLTVRAGLITGGAGSGPVFAAPLTTHPMTRDDYNYASTIDATFMSYCPWILTGLGANYGNYAGTVVFAGQTGAGRPNPGVAALFSQIDQSDFAVSNYIPWVVNNNATSNFITQPDPNDGDDGKGHSYRGVTNQDAGGADILITYTPKAGDPKIVNFVQAFIQSTTNGDGSITSPGAQIDVPSTATTPYYNEKGEAGTGTKAGSNVPLDATGSTAWIDDIPYRCENGEPTNVDCTPVGAGDPNRLDDNLLAQSQTFQSFIESDVPVWNNNGVYSLTDNGGTKTTYHVLYGGVQWGYTYSNADTPEPSSVLLVASAFAAWGLSRLFRRARHTNAEAPLRG